MTRVLLSISLALAAVSVALFVPNGARSLMIVMAAAAAASVVYLLSRCQHPAPGLLPPTTADDGTRVSARWFCDECGKTWAAGFDEGVTRPVARYSGYDESKLVSSARRAEQHARQQRELAVRRAGIGARPRKAGARMPAEVVAINGGHRLAK